MSVIALLLMSVIILCKKEDEEISLLEHGLVICISVGLVRNILHSNNYAN